MSEDYTVLTIACRDCNRVVAWDRFNQIDYTYQRARIIDLCRRWSLSWLLPERNSIGQPNIEALRNDGVNVTPFDTTNSSKADIMSNMHELLHNKGWKLLDIPIQKHEFNTFVSTKITRLSNMTLAIGLVSFIGREVGKNWQHRGYEIEPLNKFFVDSQAFILMAAVVYVIALIFKKGIEIQSENELTI
jgi:hypothetical protein